MYKNILKSFILIYFLIIIFQIIYAHELNNVVIDNGVMAYCSVGTMSGEAVSLHLFDCNLKMTKQYYLPGSIRRSGPASSQGIEFPNAWSLENKLIRALFPNLSSDALGRIVFYLWEWKNIEETYEVNKQRCFKFEGGKAMCLELWAASESVFIESLSSEPFSKRKINNDNNHIWYSVSQAKVLSLSPVDSNNDNDWKLITKPSHYKIMEYDIENNKKRISV